MELFILAVVIVLSLITTLVRMVNIRLLFGYAVFVDLFFTLTITAAFLGTFKGVIAATLAGLILGVALTIGKALMGYQRLSLRRCGLIRLRVETRSYPGLLDRMRQQHGDAQLIKLGIMQMYRKMKAAGL